MAKAGRIYIQLDVNYSEDARVADISPLAELLYIRCLCASKRLMSDGELSFTQIKRIGHGVANDLAPLVVEMLNVGLLNGEIEGWMTIPSWFSWNRTTEEIESISAARSIAGRNGGRRSAATRQAKSKQNEANVILLVNPETETETETETSLATSATPKPRERKRDELFEALVEVCAYDLKNLSRTERGRVNNATKELRELGVCPDDIRTRAATYRSKWPNVELTPQALTGNWSLLAEKNVPTSITYGADRAVVNYDELEDLQLVND